MGCALAGTLEPVSEIAVRWVTEMGAKPQASVWGRNLKTSPTEAAFANGIAIHALDFDDSLRSLRGHPSAPLMPAVLAVAEVTGASGTEALAAYAMGLEVVGKLGHVMEPDHYLRGWHSTATVGAFSATAAAARLWGLNHQELATAWAIAGSQMSGVVRNFGTMTKPFHAGHAARTGVLSAWMARQGFTADGAIFDGAHNVLETYGAKDGGVGLTEWVGRLGKPWEMSEPGIYVKRWPCCYCNHRPIGGLLELMKKHDIKPAEVIGIEVGFPPGSDAALINEAPMTGLQGKFSIEYVAAALVLDGEMTLESFTDAMVQRTEVRALMAKTRRYRIEDSGGMYSGILGYNDVALITARGRFEMRVDRVPGSPAWPMTTQDRTEKFMGCSERVLGEPGAQRLLGLLQRSTELSDVRALIAATMPATERTLVPQSTPTLVNL